MRAARRNGPGASRPATAPARRAAAARAVPRPSGVRIGFPACPLRFSTRTGWKPILRISAHPAEWRTMIPHPRRLVRRLGRILRPALVLALVAGAVCHGVRLPGRGEERRDAPSLRLQSPRPLSGLLLRTAHLLRQQSRPNPSPRRNRPVVRSARIRSRAAPRRSQVAKSSTLKWLPSVTAQSCHGDNPHGSDRRVPVDAAHAPRRADCGTSTGHPPFARQRLPRLAPLHSSRPASPARVISSQSQSTIAHPGVRTPVSSRTVRTAPDRE